MAEIGTNLQKAKKLLEQGELIGLPTETVYGLAGNALDEAAAVNIFKVKNRPAFDPLIVHSNDFKRVGAFVEEIPEPAHKLAEAFWPGPLTLLLPRTEIIPDVITSALPTVAVRVPSHPLAQELLSALDFPLAAPSANPFGYVSPTTARHVNDQLGTKIPYILDGGACQIGVESTIIGFEDDTPVVFRLGGKKIEELEEVVGAVQIRLNKSSNPVAPGMLKSHYAPGKPLIIGDIDALALKNRNKKLGIISFKHDFSGIHPEKQIILSPEGSLDEAAKGIFAALRAMDAEEVELIITEKFPEEALGRAINDRLDRASVRY